MLPVPSFCSSSLKRPAHRYGSRAVPAKPVDDSANPTGRPSTAVVPRTRSRPRQGCLVRKATTGSPWAWSKQVSSLTSAQIFTTYVRPSPACTVTVRSGDAGTGWAGGALAAAEVDGGFVAAALVGADAAGVLATPLWEGKSALRPPGLVAAPLTVPEPAVV